jgi:hypothetical protein
MEDRLLPMLHVPPLHLAGRPKGTAGLLQFGANVVAGVARAKLKSTANCLRDSSSGFIKVYS